MFENITEHQLALLIRALNSERNVIQRHIDEAEFGTHVVSFEKQREDVIALYNEAQSHPLNQRTFAERMSKHEDDHGNKIVSSRFTSEDEIMKNENDEQQDFDEERKVARRRKLEALRVQWADTRSYTRCANCNHTLAQHFNLLLTGGHETWAGYCSCENFVKKHG